MKKSFRPSLERCEDRCVPATLVWDAPALTVNDSWGTAGNWYNQTASAVATSPPSANDDVVFDSSSPLSCNITGTQVCRSISTSSWSGTVYVNGLLSLYHYNGHDSLFQSGTMETTNGSGKLNILGGVFEYKVSEFNFVSADFDVFVSHDGELALTGSSINRFNADVFVGKNSSGAESDGKFTVFAANSVGFFYGGDPVKQVYVTGSGTFDVDGAGVNDLETVSYGTVNLKDGTYSAATYGLDILGGWLNVRDETTYNVSADVVIQNATLRMGETANKYNTLAISGDLTLGTDAQYWVDVNKDSLSQADKVTATNITLDSSASIHSFDSAGPMVGSHAHDILVATNDITTTVGGISTSNINWNVTYLAKKVQLTLVVLPNDEGPPG